MKSRSHPTTVPVNSNLQPKEKAALLARLARLAQTDPALSTLYRRFLAAVAKVAQADTPDMQAGSTDEGTAAQKRQHALWERRLDAAGVIFHTIMRAPARSIDGMLLKIHLRGWHDEASGRAYSPVIGTPDWHPKGATGRSWEAELLDSLRADLRRLQHPERDKLAGQLLNAIVDHHHAFVKWAPVTAAANAACDARYPGWHVPADQPGLYKQALALRKRMTAKHRHHERALSRTSHRCEALSKQIMKRNAKSAGDLKARTLVLLYEMHSGFFNEPGLRFPDDGGATRFLFDHAAEQSGLAPVVQYIENELAACAREIKQKLRAIRKRTKKGGAK